MNNIIIFLDIDGVICIAGYLDRNNPPPRKVFTELNKNCINILNKIIELTKAKIVISSSWRKFFNIHQLREQFKEAGFIGEILDTTPILKGLNGGNWTPRGVEIQTYLDNHPEITNYVIIDDEISDMKHLVNKCVETDGIYSNGLEERHIVNVLNILSI